MSSPLAPPHFTIERHLPTEAGTLALGADLASVLEPGLVIDLRGDLGAGKTTLARGLLHALGWQGKVKSPTYTLVEVYSLFKFDLYHFDLYRFKNALEWEESGFGEYCHPGSVCLIEWPEKAAGIAPPADLRINLTERGDARDARIVALTARGEACLLDWPKT